MRRVRKQLPIPGAVDDDNDRIWCNWEDCPNPASYLHKVQVCHAARPYKHSDGRRCRYCEVKCFCSAQCLDWWSHSHEPGRFGKLSAGINARYL